MNPNKNPFSELASKAKRGDAAAQIAMRRQMESEMIRIVRRSLKDGKGTTPLDRRIHAEAERIGVDFAVHTSEEQEQIVHRIAKALCASVLSHLRPAPAPQAAETIYDSALSA